ncbi:copper homeostasis protein [Leuconostoc litchii]|uniref:Copper homeostasis protein cutC homolog n=1 Tax=Leuconostoc litchii TaxID=1981069 RepID=A0A6P2CNR5_9LACO|nr:copper homeostasis protein CutC [Leuconostoc litchii]TYC46641.1 copper resistance protein [Leuconostoc litchii]GMA70507.1 copper homeostasis protein [Leuconostoc litchii]
MIKIKEAAVDSVQAARTMISRGANRLELSDRLDLGGITPDTKTIIDTLEVSNKIPVVIMVRPRGGNFEYNETEIHQMLDTIQIIADVGGEIVTFGAIVQDDLDFSTMMTLIEFAQTLNIQVVMHMAFDDIAIEKQQYAMNWLYNQGISRILTHGGAMDLAVTETLVHLQTLIRNAPAGMTILPGGGITKLNANTIANKLGVRELHGTQIV